MKANSPFVRPALLAFSTTLALASFGILSAQEPPAAAPVPPEQTAPLAPIAPNVPRTRAGRDFTGRYQDVVQFGGDAVLEKGEIANTVVSIGGSAIANGEVRQGVVAIAGNASATGPVGDDVVAIFGNASATNRVRRGVVAIGGSVKVDGPVDNDVVAILGDVDLGPNAAVSGNVVSIGGAIHRAPGSTIRGNLQSIGVGGTMDFTRYQAWMRQCLLYGRPLGFGRGLAWAWGVAFLFLLFYTGLAFMAGGPMEKCLVTLRERPGRTILATLLALVLTPLILVLVAATGVGLIVEPILVLGIFAAGLFGRAVLLAGLGRGLLRPFGGAPAMVVSVVLGGVLVSLLYTIPIVGFLLWKLLGAFGFGLVVYTMILGQKRERPVAAAAGPAGTMAAMPVPPAFPSSASFSTAEPPPVFGLVPAAPAPAPFPAPAPVSPPATWPRAGFWRRFLALALDALLIGILVGPLTKGVMVLPGLAIYAACLWRARGTTIGGIIFGLKVVRLDDRPVDWTTSIVRALGCFISLGVVFLGFFWIAFDDEKQAWHDKIAGTVVVRPPRGMSLI